jgi:hypothetical protein
MRMWLCDPKIMCHKHLCGEHLEMHMFLGALKEGKKINGYIENNLFEPMILLFRHDELAKEMILRKYKNISPMPIEECHHVFNLPPWERLRTINKEKALKTLLDRCPECRKRATSFGFRPLAST